MSKTLCFTGHRPNKLGGYTGPKAEKIQGDLFNHLVSVVSRAFSKGFDTFISGGALGVDQIAAKAVLFIKDHNTPIKLVIAKPFPSQSCKWPESSQKQFNWICSQADKVVDVSPDPYTREKMQVRNEWMVDNSVACCAVSNGTGGGTGNCIKYAQSQFKPILKIDPYTLEEKWYLPPKNKW